MNLRLPSDPHLRRWMLFVDGENLTLRAQDLAKDIEISLVKGPNYEPNVYVWLPNHHPREAFSSDSGMRPDLRNQAIRAYYYTSVQGDQTKLDAVRNALWDLGFHPEVFKKKGGTKSKGVDIMLAKDMLANAYYDNYDAAVLVAGDGDYVPLIDEIKRLGKVVILVFFDHPQSGLSNELKLASDRFLSLAKNFEERWRQAT